jgi:hypothetical protein
MTAIEFKAARLAMGHTQQQFAIALGYTNFVSISRKEIGTATISAADEIIIGFLREKPRKKKKEKIEEM